MDNEIQAKKDVTVEDILVQFIAEYDLHRDFAEYLDEGNFSLLFNSEMDADFMRGYLRGRVLE